MWGRLGKNFYWRTCTLHIFKLPGTEIHIHLCIMLKINVVFKSRVRHLIWKVRWYSTNLRVHAWILTFFHYDIQLVSSSTVSFSEILKKEIWFPYFSWPCTIVMVAHDENIFLSVVLSLTFWSTHNDNSFLMKLSGKETPYEGSCLKRDFKHHVCPPIHPMFFIKQFQILCHHLLSKLSFFCGLDFLKFGFSFNNSISTTK